MIFHASMALALDNISMPASSSGFLDHPGHYPDWVP